MHNHPILFMIVLVIVFFSILFWPDSNAKILKSIDEKIDKLVKTRARHYDDGK